MAILPIMRLGHPALRTPAKPVSPEQLAEPEMQTLIDDMLETMMDAGGVGLAAPQVGLPWQLFVYAAVDGPRKPSTEEPEQDGDHTEPEGPELKVLVNPGLEPESRETVYDWEGCLSIPDLRGLVPRYPVIAVHALDRHGERVSFQAERYEARIIQHEFDHLNGMIFLDRMRDLRSLSYREEWLEYMTEDPDDEGAAEA